LRALSDLCTVSGMPDETSKLSEIRTVVDEWKARVHARGQALRHAQDQGLTVDTLKTLDLLLGDATQTLEAVSKALLAPEAPGA
jgi:hypothetical protein